MQRLNLSELSLQYGICGDNGIPNAFTALEAGSEFEDLKPDRVGSSQKVQTPGTHARSVIEQRLATLEQSVKRTEEELLREARSIQAQVHDLEQMSPSTQSSSASVSPDLHEQVLASPQSIS